MSRKPFADPLIAPRPQAPEDGGTFPFAASGQPPTVDFAWSHGTPTPQVPSPHQADQFILCVYDAQRGRCESGVRKGVPQPIWVEAAADDPAINRSPVREERLPFVAPLGIHLGYRFETSLRMRPEYRNRALLWRVGACLDGTCRMSEPQSLRLEMRESSSLIELFR